MSTDYWIIFVSLLVELVILWLLTTHKIVLDARYNAIKTFLQYTNRSPAKPVKSSNSWAKRWSLKMIKRVSGGGSGIDPSLLGSIVSYTSPSSPYKFKFPAITPPTVQFGGRPNRAKAAVANCSSFPSFKAPSSMFRE